MKKDITVIITLYKTPIKKLKALNQYKNFKVIIFAQETEKNYQSIIKKNSIIKFKYYFSKKNIGLPKATNHLISKVKTKYFLFTQADIFIDEKSIKYLKNAFKYCNDLIFTGPSFKNKRKNGFQIKNKLHAACMLCDTKKTKKIGFFDEDFFLYWEDIFLMRKINLSKFKMLQTYKAIARHLSGKSSISSTKVELLRNLNFKYGEYLFDHKTNKFRFIKLVRQLLQNLVAFPISCLILKKKLAIKNIASVLGIIKFIIFCFKK
ncbi:MAG: glycosyltransferase [Candidatus Pelagibacter sp.]